MSRAHMGSTLNIVETLEQAQPLIGAWLPFIVNKEDIVNGFQPVVDTATLTPQGVYIAGSSLLYYSEDIANLVNGSFTCWALTTPNSQNRHLFCQWDTTGNANSIFDLSMNSSGNIVFNCGGATIQTSKSFDDNGWHHYAVAWKENDAISIYVDGILESSGTMSMIGNIGGRYSGRIPIGHRGWSYDNEQWNGYISSAIWYSNILSPSQVIESMPNPLLYYSSEGGVCT